MFVRLEVGVCDPLSEKLWNNVLHGESLGSACSCYWASAADLQLLGAAAGRKTAKLVRPLRLVQGRGPGAVAEVGGVNIHAAVAVDGRAPLAP